MVLSPDYYIFLSIIHPGIQESESGEPSKSEPHVDMRKFCSHCEKNGYGVKVVDGNHFSQNNSYFVELKLGNMFHVELSNSNDHGKYDHDIQNYL